ESPRWVRQDVVGRALEKSVKDMPLSAIEAGSIEAIRQLPARCSHERDTSLFFVHPRCFAYNNQGLRGRRSRGGVHLPSERRSPDRLVRCIDVERLGHFPLASGSEGSLLCRRNLATSALASSSSMPRTRLAPRSLAAARAEPEPQVGSRTAVCSST